MACSPYKTTSESLPSSNPSPSSLRRARRRTIFRQMMPHEFLQGVYPRGACFTTLSLTLFLMALKLFDLVYDLGLEMGLLTVFLGWIHREMGPRLRSSEVSLSGLGIDHLSTPYNEC